MALELKQPVKRTRHVLTEVESKFKNIIPGWIPQLRKKAKGEQMKQIYDKDLGGYQYCFVGDVRAKLGLSRDYHNYNEHDSFCVICVNHAKRFNIFEGYDEYMFCLRLFESHLKDGHGVKLEVVNS